MTVLVLHTTETRAGTAQAVARNLLRDGKAPHQVYDPSDGTLVHCHDWTVPGAALKNLAGGVETNRRGGVLQVEIVGFAADVARYDDRWYENLGRYLVRVCDQTRTPKKFPYPFIAGGYGVGAAQRLTNAQWLAVEGIVGHQHVPENSHWDPGGLDVARLLPYMIPPVPPTPSSTDFGAVDMSNVHTKLVPVGPLDPNGNGWNVVDFGFPVTRIIGVACNGPNPQTDGYWPLPRDVSAQMRGNGVVVTATQGWPGSTVNVWVSAA